VFVSGHSSTAISAGLGLAVAGERQQQNYYTVSVVGDGSLTGGLAYEGLNNAGRMKGTKHIVILNDNKMSISQNVGAMARHLAAVRIRPGYFKAKDDFTKLLLRIPKIGRLLYRGFFKLKTILKNGLYHSTIFEDMGFSYLGPIDGHDLKKLETVLELAKCTRRPALIHVCTCKGKGYPYAEKTPKDYHGVSSGMDLNTGECKPSSDSFSHVFGRTLCRLAEENPKICAITAAMCDGTGLTEFAQKFPDRFFDVGIAEEHAITFASGLAKGGMIPFVAIYSSFLQRGYDQLIHDVAAQGVKVIVCVDRAGFVGEDGEMHNGLLDVSFLRSIPHAKVYSPANFAQLEKTLTDAVEEEGSLIAIRYPRGGQADVLADKTLTSPFEVIGSGKNTVGVVTYGRLVGECVKGISPQKADVIAVHRLKPLSSALVDTLCAYKKLYFIEETPENGGISQEILATLCKIGYNGKVQTRNVGDCFVSQAPVNATLQQFGLTGEQIAQWIFGDEVAENV
jgi:1-deoxy-D-xylulose-5-phosphate synthase